MKRIHRLHLRHFKAFTDQKFDFEGKHALIFGPNGSGKSSIFAALQAFLRSAGEPMEVYESLKESRVLPPPSRTDYITDEQFSDARWDWNRQRRREGMKPSSLLRLYASSGESASIVITWFDDVLKQAAQRTVSADNTLWHRKQRGDHRLLETESDPVIREAFLASEFIGYRQTQIFDQSSRRSLNVWPTFVNNLFPYYQPLGSNSSFTEIIDSLFSRMPRTKITRHMANDKRFRNWSAEFDVLNGQISLFIEQVATGANAFLAQLFSSEPTKIELLLGYDSPFVADRFGSGDFDYGAWDQMTSDQRRQALVAGREYSLPSIPLSVRLVNPALSNGGYSTDQPQNFLNEARLTRIALALRLGALQSRPAAAVSDFRVLCLDDLLISLDMENRRHVLDWLFDPQVGIHDTYQIFFLTHDRDLHRMLAHYIQTRQPGAWKYHEVYMDESQSPPTPYVPPHQTTNHAEAARRSFHRHEFAACANELRRACEKAILEFLPERYRLRLDKNGLPETLTLEKLIDALAKLFKEYAQDFAPYRDLKLYKDLHLNPLSHHYETPVVMQHELRHFMDKVLPPLLNLRAELEIERHPLVATFVDMPLTGRNGAVTTYRLRLFEPLHRLHFDATTVRRSNPKCQVVGMLPIQADGLPTPPPSAWLDKETTLHYVYGQLLRALGVIAAGCPALEAINLQVV